MIHVLVSCKRRIYIYIYIYQNYYISKSINYRITTVVAFISNF